MQQILETLTANLTWTLAAIFAVILVLAVLVFFLARKALLGSSSTNGTGGVRGWVQGVRFDARTRNTEAGLRRSFEQALRFLSRAIPGRNPRYRLPWYLMLGQARGGKTTLLGRSGLSLPFGEPVPPPGSSRTDCGWWYYQQGIVLDVSGDLVLRSDGRTSDDDAWKTLLRLLERSRPERPADGIVLSIPATEVYDVSGQGGDLMTEAAHRAAILYQKLWDAQTALSMQLPVYVVITQSDLLPGFSSFLASIPNGTSGQMFGWSTPDSPETAYTGAWPDRIFSELESSLNEALVEVLGGEASVDPRQAEQAFLLSRSVKAVQEPVRVYLNQIFTPSSYHDDFFLRGLYFAGGQFDPKASPAPLPWDTYDTPAPTAAPVPSGAHPSAIVFSHDVLTDKTFPEDPVGVPTASAVSARHRLRFALQAGMLLLVLLGTLGLPRAYREVSADAAPLGPFLDGIYDDLTAPGGSTTAQAALTTATPSDPRSDSVDRLLLEARQIQTYRPWSILMPTSWLSPFYRGIVKSTAKGYDGIVMPSLETALTDELTLLAQVTPPPAQDYDQAPTYYQDTREFVRLQSFLQTLKPTEARVGSYDCVAETCKSDGTALLADLNGLLRHVYGDVLAPPTGGATRFYERMVRRIDAEAIEYPPVGSDYGLQNQATTLSRRFYSRLFTFNAVVADLNALTDEINSLAAQSSTITSLDAYQRLLDLINQTQTDLTQPEVAWMGNATFDLGSPYTDALAAMQASAFLGGSTSQAVLANGQAGFRQLKVDLANYSSPYTGPFLASKGGQVQLALSPGLLQLQSALQSLLGQSFLTAQPARQIVETPPQGTVLLWSAPALAEAQGLVAPYQDFLGKGLDLFPAALQGQVTQVATANLETNMIDTVAEAQQFPPQGDPTVPSALEWSVQSQVSNFQTNSPALSDLLNTFAFLRLRTASTELTGAVTNQQNGMLTQIDDLLTMQNLYSPQDPYFNDWDGNPTLSFLSFNVTSADGLNDYLAGQRAIVTNLVNSYANPLSTAAIRTTPQVTPLVTKWQTLAADVSAYTNKMAGNPILSLETFITANMTAVTLPTCFAQIPASDPRGTSADYFLSKQAVLRRGVYDRCQVLTGQDGRTAYLQLAQYFNDRLAGRFPFTASGEGTPGELVEASAAALQGFYQLYDQSQTVINNIPQGSSALGAQEAEVRQFMSDMADVRTLIAPFLADPKTYPAPALDLQVDFRVNRSQEKNANQVIRWTLTIGDGGAGTQTLVEGNPKPVGNWALGTPVTLRLDWAGNSPSVPLAVSVADSFYAYVEGRSLVYQYRNLWSLILLIRDNPSGPREVPETLKLLARTQPADAGSTATTDPVQAFVRVTLLDPTSQGKTQVFLPEFPATAPVL
ncbi:MAG TPA: type VI secretion protein IcmF/TssM N-terminal domain-containing protein [Thermoanaerobaculia bacterium]|nr:type VI secretion protein IcmF/TssM N-terminal domain-containing protein [Thermoanaerobaculia bacterium]